MRKGTLSLLIIFSVTASPQVKARHSSLHQVFPINVPCPASLLSWPTCSWSPQGWKEGSNQHNISAGSKLQVTSGLILRICCLFLANVRHFSIDIATLQLGTKQWPAPRLTPDKSSPDRPALQPGLAWLPEQADPQRVISLSLSREAERARVRHSEVTRDYTENKVKVITLEICQSLLQAT